MARFFLAASNIRGGVAYLDKASMEHLRVLRIRQGETFTVCSGDGRDYICRLRAQGADEGCAEILEERVSSGEPSVFCRVFAAYSKGDRMDTAVQKCSEIGAGEIIVFPSARCVSRPDAAGALKKTARWQRIAEEAAKQSGREIVPRVTAAKSFESAVADAAGADLSLFLYENEREISISSLLNAGRQLRTVSVMSGPEGGFEPAEAAFAAQAGMQHVTLGSRILRCETAPICAVTAVMLLTGNM